jgi:hypothetical protein
MRAGPVEMLFTSAGMIAAVTSVLAGVGVALLLDAGVLVLPGAVSVGAVAAIGVFGLHMVWMYRRGRPAMA